MQLIKSRWWPCTLKFHCGGAWDHICPCEWGGKETSGIHFFLFCWLLFSLRVVQICFCYTTRPKKYTRKTADCWCQKVPSWFTKSMVILHFWNYYLIKSKNIQTGSLLTHNKYQCLNYYSDVQNLLYIFHFIKIKKSLFQNTINFWRKNFAGNFKKIGRHLPLLWSNQVGVQASTAVRLEPGMGERSCGGHLDLGFMLCEGASL